MGPWQSAPADQANTKKEATIVNLGLLNITEDEFSLKKVTLTQ